jgi:transposase InsO family protein
MARLLKVSRSGFYTWCKRTERPDVTPELTALVERAWLESDRRFGHRSIHAYLALQGHHLTLYRVLKIMRALGIKGCTPYAKKRTTIPGSGDDGRPDLIRRDFTSAVPTTRLVGDITHLKTSEGWLYLATVIDLSTRMVVGFALSERMTADIVVSALECARARGYVAKGSVFHSDRGSQYTSRLLASWANKNDVRLSVGRTGSSHDNAVAESFFASIKNEMYHRRRFSTRSEAKNAVVNYIETYYNRRRPHSTIGYQIPAQVMEAFMQRCDKAFGLDDKGRSIAA